MRWITIAETIGVKVGRKTIEQPLTVKIALDSDDREEYIGEAAPGTLVSASKWRIKKLTYNSSGITTDVKWADGSANFDKEWDERAGYAYS